MNRANAKGQRYVAVEAPDTSANGCGYDKLTAALDGCTLGGFEVGDHCNGRGLPTPGELIRREGWHVFGSDVRTS